MAPGLSALVYNEAIPSQHDCCLMTTTIDQLDAITKTPEANMLPVSASMSQAAGAAATWWDHVDRVVHFATESDMMVVALYAKATLETYPGLVKSIMASWSIYQEKDEIYVNSFLQINDDHYHPDSHDLDEDLLDQMSEIDDQRALQSLHCAVESAMSSRQASRELMARVESVFSEITSIEDVDAIIAKIDPAIRSFYEQKLMQNQTPAAPGPKGMGRI